MEETAAERYYKKHLKNVSNYQKNNPEKMREKCKKYNERLKEDPEKYQLALQKKRDYYMNVKRPQLQAAKLAKQASQDKQKSQEI